MAPGAPPIFTPIAICASECQKHKVKQGVAKFTLVKHSTLEARMSKPHSKMITFLMEISKTHSETINFWMKIRENPSRCCLGSRAGVILCFPKVVYWPLGYDLASSLIIFSPEINIFENLKKYFSKFIFSHIYFLFSCMFKDKYP